MAGHTVATVKRNWDTQEAPYIGLAEQPVGETVVAGATAQALIATALPRTGYRIAKRCLDVIAGLAGIALCLPLWAAIAVAIRLDSKGPVIFKQQRPGLNGVPFTMLKFRTMVKDAEAHLSEVMHLSVEPTGSLIRIKHDPRVTRVGGFLRATSLDETPQLLNVLLGQMSLVGPRPISRPIDDVRNPIRLRVTPGLTGLWQISGRKDTGCAFMLDRDMEYICKRSFLYDLGIILMTVLVVVRGRGAR
jgi:lipopolysaccharide/colanic/teichoic acid biosynthesis glycosyltransferase